MINSHVIYKYVGINIYLLLQKPAVRTTAGVLDCPLGKTRLHVARLLMALLSTENIKIHEALVDLGTFQTLLVSINFITLLL